MAVSCQVDIFFMGPNCYRKEDRPRPYFCSSYTRFLESVTNVTKASWGREFLLFLDLLQLPSKYFKTNYNDCDIGKNSVG